MQTAVYVERSRIETREAPLPVLGHGDILLRVVACGVCGTDIRKVQHNLVSPPIVLGHEVAGEVVKVGEGVSKFTIGDRVVVAHHTPCYKCHYCRHGNHSMCRKFKASNLDPGGFAEFVRVPADHVELTAHKIPEGMPYERAIFMEPLACAIRNLKRTTIQPGDTAWIVGLGSMGILTGQLIRQMGGKVIATDLREDRRTIAQSLHFDAVLDARSSDIQSTILGLTENRGVDLVVLTAGTAVLYSDVVNHVRDGGSISVFAGLAPGARVSFDINELYSREITVYTSYSPSPAELVEALEHLKQGTVNVDILSSRSFELSELASAIAEMSAGRVMKAIIAPQEHHA